MPFLNANLHLIMAEVILTRKELYDQVWSVPMTQLAKKYALSDVGLAKICRKHNIPRPSRGWWAQKQAGYRVTSTPLPQGDTDEKIRISVNHQRATERDRLRDIVAGARPKRRAPEKFSVPQTLTDPHPLIIASEDILSTIAPDENGLVPPPLQTCLNIYVSPQSRGRALSIMDTLIKVLTAKDYVVTASKRATRVIVHGVPLPIALTEDLRQERLRARDHKLEGHYEFGYDRYARNVPSGKLQLRIGEPTVWNQPMRHVWRDTNNQRIEDVLYTFVSGLIKVAAATTARTNDHPPPEKDHESSTDI